MAIIKCKMCGGDLNIVEGSTVAECEYCGTKQTVPSADSERKLTLFNRAGRLLRACEFDKAAGVFESIVADFPEEAEAYWGLVLCKYGIEYVDDPATGKKIPTCHRSSFDSVLDDPNFEQACENTDAVARRVYRDEARQIEDLRQAILQVSGKEEPYDVFISYKETDENGDRTLDSVIAQDIYTELTERGYRVFFSRISLEEKLGTEYEPYIFAALNSAKVMLVVGTDYENFDSVWVKNEWSRYLKQIAAGQKKTLIPVFKNMDPYDMPKEFKKLAAQDMDKVGAMQDLVRGVEKLVGKKKEIVKETVKETVVIQQGGESSARVTAAMDRGYMALEDGEFDKAIGFFDQVLSLDAKNARAYYGMALARAKCRDAEAYIRQACSHTPTTDNIELPPDTKRIREAAAKYAVPGYLSAEEITELYRSNPTYPSAVRSQKQLNAQAKNSFETNRDFGRARQFAEGETSVELERLQQALYERLEKALQQTEEDAEEAKKQAEQDYRSFLDGKDRLAEEKSREAKEQREADYRALVSAFEKTSDCMQLPKLQKQFEAFGDYRDARALAKRCAEKITAIKKAGEEAAERERLLKERAEKVNKKKKMTIGLILAGVLALVIASVAINKTVIQPNQQYQRAMALYQDEKYEQAITEFERLGNYKDSAEMITRAKKAMNERDYASAEALLVSGKQEEAMIAFAALNNYRDSKKRLESIKKDYYSKTLRSASAGDTILFGSYEQDCDNSNGKEMIEWLVLKTEGNKQLLLVSKKMLDWKPVESFLGYHHYTWDECQLRTWLNGDFVDGAFSLEEQEMIKTTQVLSNPAMYDAQFPVSQGKDTRDKVFLLSTLEAESFFASSKDRQCEATESVKQKMGSRPYYIWWLRTSGTSEHTAIVDSTGDINGYGRTQDEYLGVRPALWIDLTA